MKSVEGGGCRVKARCWRSHLAVNVNQIHQLLGLVAVPRHFALFVPEGQLRREKKEQNAWLHDLPVGYLSAFSSKKVGVRKSVYNV